MNRSDTYVVMKNTSDWLQSVLLDLFLHLIAPLNVCVGCGRHLVYDGINTQDLEKKSTNESRVA